MKKNVFLTVFECIFICFVFSIPRIAISYQKISSDPSVEFIQDATCDVPYALAKSAVKEHILEPGREEILYPLEAALVKHINLQSPDKIEKLIKTASDRVSSTEILGENEESKRIIHQKIDILHACLQKKYASAMSWLHLRINPYYLPGGVHTPGGEKVLIFLNQIFIGTTVANKEIVFPVPPGDNEIVALDPGAYGTKFKVHTSASETKHMAIDLQDDTDPQFEAKLTIADTQSDIVSFNAPMMVLKLYSNGELIPLIDGSEVRIQSIGSKKTLDVSKNITTTKDGYITITKNGMDKINDFISANNNKGIIFYVNGTDNNYVPYHAEKKFFLANNQLKVQLISPKSDENISLEKAVVNYTLIGSDLSLSAKADSHGAVFLPKVPNGVAEIQATIANGGKYYRADAICNPIASGVIQLYLHKANIESTPSDYRIDYSDKSAISLKLTEQRPESTSLLNTQRALNSQFQESDFGVYLLAISKEKDIKISDVRTITAKKGTQKMYLKYQIYSDEYPKYLTKNSAYNDVFGIDVVNKDSNTSIYSLRQSINDLNQENPLYFSDKITRDIYQVIDISLLTKDSDATFDISIFAMNVGDGSYPTFMYSHVSTSNDALILSNMRADPNETLKENQQDTGTFYYAYSIPLMGEKNTFLRHFLFDFDVPDNASIIRLRTDILDLQGHLLSTLYDEKEGVNFQQIDKKTLFATVSSIYPSTMNTTPPPAHDIIYRMTVLAQSPSGKTWIAQASTKPVRALWRMPAYWRLPVRRYGGLRDVGYDDWLSTGTWNFLDRHGDLITRINDISGEHGRNIGHTQHKYGTDLDLYHVYAFPGADDLGGTNYLLLLHAVSRILTLPNNQSLDDQANVSEWVARTRERFQRVLTETDAEKIYYAIGNSYEITLPNTSTSITLPRGWAKSLLVDGKIQVAGRTFDTHFGPWEYYQHFSDKFTFNEIHNSHWHLTRPIDD